MEIEGADVGISAYEAYGQVSETKEEADRLEAAYDQDQQVNNIASTVLN